MDMHERTPVCSLVVRLAAIAALVFIFRNLIERPRLEEHQRAVADAFVYGIAIAGCVRSVLRYLKERVTTPSSNAMGALPAKAKAEEGERL